jgi:hypothetical protein
VRGLRLPGGVLACAGPGTALAPARPPPHPTPPKKNGPRGPARGKGQRRTAGGHRRVTRWPPPATPLGGWSPQVPTTAREAKMVLYKGGGA